MLSEELISSKSIIIRTSSKEDLEFVLMAEQDPKNNKYIIRWSELEHLDAMNNKDKIHMIIESTDNGKVGFCILSGLSNKNGCIELIRIVIVKKGNGYGKESINLLQKYVFEKLKAHRFWLDVKEHNYRARELYENRGFVIEGNLREALKSEKGYESLVIMGMLETEYNKIQRKL
ncbi:GNAT family N-acetyltransferase [Paenibacillus sp. SYP-B4298]|uniref:GNAT family N-acetyltransferase n=1 Tax=Paenibacillus sp. SYP-B4298 TaxID=2996034 RepID=UPI0022DD61A5|nr:GNAT family protein [Paenibacillus sp. SYP-B4298]